MDDDAEEHGVGIRLEQRGQFGVVCVASLEPKGLSFRKARLQTGRAIPC